MKRVGGKVLVKYMGSFFILLHILLFLGCGSAKDMKDRPTFETLSDLMEEQGIEIEHQWANPLSGSMINLIGNPNYVRFTKDSVDIFLPYFGVRHTGGGYGNREGGIVYRGIPKELVITKNKQKGNIMLKFRGDQGNENLRFIITLYTDGGANTSVNSSQRDAISYRGNFNSLPQKQKVDVLLDRKY